MDLRKLKTLIDLVSESGISELEVTEGEGKVRIVKNAPPVYVQPSASYAPQYAMPAQAPGGAIEAPAAAATYAKRCNSFQRFGPMRWIMRFVEVTASGTMTSRPTIPARRPRL